MNAKIQRMIDVARTDRDHEVIGSAVFDSQTGELKESARRVYYRDHPRFQDMPILCQSDASKKAYDLFWRGVGQDDGG